MGRAKRVHREGAAVRIEAEAMRGEGLYRDEYDRESFVERLEELRERHGFRVDACTLLNWRIDLVITVGKVSASVIMRDLLGHYARYYNKRYRLKGHVFIRRHHQWIAENREAAVLHARLQPVAAGMTGDPGAWEWSRCDERTEPPRWPSGFVVDLELLRQAALAAEYPGSLLWLLANGGPPGRGRR